MQYDYIAVIAISVLCGASLGMILADWMHRRAARRRIPPPAVLCDDLTYFADGELDGWRHRRFMGHLDACGACRAGLLQHVQMTAQLGSIAPSWSKLSPQWRAEDEKK